MPSPTLKHLLAPIAPFLADPDVEEIAVQKPGEAFVFSRGVFTRHEIALDARQAEDIAHYAAAHRRQDIGGSFPLLSTELPGGERLQAVLPPCVGSDCPSLTIRRHSTFSPTLEGLAAKGLFDGTVKRKDKASPADAELRILHERGDWLAFMRLAARSGKTLLLCGANATGKTTYAKAYANAIPPHERIITIEDTAEWNTLPHENRVALFYSKGGQGATKVGATDLVEAALRMRIGRLMVQELRDAAAYSFARALASGHPGLSTCHAADCDGAFEALALMVKEAPPAASRPIEEVKVWLRSLIDIVLHCARDGDRFGISEVWMREA